MSRLSLIINPDAGSGETVEEIIDRLRETAPLEVLRTGAPGDAARFAGQAVDGGRRRIVVGGGDGTLNEVVNGLAPRFDNAEVAILPLGTANDLARCRELPGDVEAALAAIREWRTLRVDVGRIQGPEGERHFLNAVTGGFSSRVSEEVGRQDKLAWGALAYTVSAARALPELQSYRIRVELDGDREEEIESSCLNIVVANGRHVGGGLTIAPKARLDDGLLDVLLVPEMPLPRLALVVSRLLAGNPGWEEQLLVRRAARIRIDAEPGIELTADGEPTGTTPVSIDVLPGALRLVRGPDPGD